MIAGLDDPRLLETEFVDWLIESDYLTREQKRQYAPILDVANRLALQPKQMVAEQLSQETDELLFGGAAGPGKTEWLIRHCAREMLKKAAGHRERFVAAGDLDWRLRQATGIAKAPYVAEFVRLLMESTEKLILWGWHHAVYDIWMQRLASFNPALYTGNESPKQKNAAEDAFKHGDSRILIMSLRSGVGLDGLQEVCNVGVFGELDWSPEQHRQCIGRLDRDGQPVTPAIYYLTADDGSDPVISEVLQIKRQQAEPIRDPNRPLFEQQVNAEDRIRLLAEAALKRATDQNQQSLM